MCWCTGSLSEMTWWNRRAAEWLSVYREGMGAVLWYPLCEAASHLGGCIPRKADDRGLVRLCTEPDKEADEGHADRSGYDFKLVFPA